MTDLKAYRVLVTPRSFGKSDPGLKAELERAVGVVVYGPTDRSPSAGEVRELLPGCDGYIAGLEKIDRSALEAADRLKVIARYGVGMDSVDLAAAHEKGIIVTNTPGANAVSVAELTIGLMLSLARMIPQANAQIRAGEWRVVAGVTLEGKTVGLLGLGAVGRQVARRLCGFDCTILAYDPAADVAFAQEHGVRLCPQDEVLAQSDFLSLHVPLLPETQGMVSTLFLSRMKLGAFLINTARGELVDEDALVAALRGGHLKGVALDAFAKEPPDRDNPLFSLPQVIVTPHIGAHADGATNAMGWAALRDCLAVLRGEEPAHRVV